MIADVIGYTLMAVAVAASVLGLIKNHLFPITLPVWVVSYIAGAIVLLEL